MDVAIVGAGPGGLYAGILLRAMGLARRVTIYERNGPDDTFGWGVVLSNDTLANIEEADPASHSAIRRAAAGWDPVDVWYRGERIRCRGHAFSAIARKTLLNVLRNRCLDLGVDLRFHTEISDVAGLSDADLVVVADGANSAARSGLADAFGTRLRTAGGKYIWLGTTKVLDCFTFIFRRNEHGSFQVHAYPFRADLSTLVVECDEATWRAAGLDQYASQCAAPGESDASSIAYCERLFADDLDGHALLGNNSKWLDFVTVTNRTWHRGNVVLLGDAAHTAHFSIGSGTKMAVEDAIELVRQIRVQDRLDSALRTYEAERKPIVEATQDSARESLSWFEDYHRYLGFDAPQFAYSLLTRSRRVTYRHLITRDPGFVQGYDAWFAGRRDGAPAAVAPPPAFAPLSARALQLRNRLVAVPQPSTGSADGHLAPQDKDQLHRAARTGVGLVIAAGVAVAPDARITPRCPGLWGDRHARQWRELLEAVREDTSAAIGVELSHAGRRGSTRPRRQGLDRPLGDGGWPLVSASALPYGRGSPVPAELDADGMRTVVDEFVCGARLADEGGFDLLQLQFGHGYLLASFLSPLSNVRSDGYGGCLDNRARFPLLVLRAVREAWPGDKPLTVRFSADDWHPGGITAADAVALAGLFTDAGADLLHVVAGQTTSRFAPATYEPCFYAPVTDLVRNGAGVPTIASGNVTSTWTAHDVVAAGKADLCVLDQGIDDLVTTWVRK